MERFKLEIFENESGHELNYESATIEQINFMDNFFTKIGLAIDQNTLFFRNLIDKLPNKKDYDDYFEEQSTLKAILAYLNISDSEVLLIWDYPSEVDSFKTEYLIENWCYVWFPPADDAVALFFPLSSRLLMLTHYGVLYWI